MVRTIKRTPVHCNSNQLTVVTCKTTGPRPGYHELLQLSLVPLNARYEPLKDYPIFDVLLRPEYPNRFEEWNIKHFGTEHYQQCLAFGEHRESVVDLLWNWYKCLDLMPGKKMSPMVFNWRYISSFIIDLVGWDNFHELFDEHVRDVRSTADFLNDRADCSAEQIPVPGFKITPTKCLERFGGVVDGHTGDALYEAKIIYEVYKKFLQEPFV